MKLKRYIVLEDIFLILWGAILIGILLGENCPIRLIAETNAAKLLALPTFMTIFLSRLRRREKSSHVNTQFKKDQPSVQR